MAHESIDPTRLDSTVYYCTNKQTMTTAPLNARFAQIPNKDKNVVS